MSNEKFPLGYQFFSSVLMDKGVDRPTIDFVWEHGESLYLWQQSFGHLTKAELQKMGEVAWEVNASTKNLPPLQMVNDTQGYLRFDSFDFLKGEVRFWYCGKLVNTMRPGARNYPDSWDASKTVTITGLDGKILFHTTPS